MKKRNLIVCIYCVMLNVFCYAQEFYLKEDIIKNQNNTILIDSDKILSFSKNFGFFILDTYEKTGNSKYQFIEKIYLSDINQKKEYQILTSDLILLDYNKKIFNQFSNCLWIPKYYYEQLKENNNFNVILKNEKYWNDFNPVGYSDEVTLFDIFQIKTLNFRDYYFFFSGNTWKKEVSFYATIDKQESNLLVYNVEKVFNCSSEYSTQNINNAIDWTDPNLLPYLAENLPYKVYFVFDGDYVNMYVREISEENLFQTFIRTTPKSCIAIENWIKGKSNNLSEVIWPHHADGTSEYEDTIRYPDPVVIEEPEEIQIEEYQEEKEEIKNDKPPYPDKKDPNYMEILKEYYPEDYSALRFAYYQKRRFIINKIIIPSSIVLGLFLIVFIIIKKKRKSAK